MNANESPPTDPVPFAHDSREVWELLGALHLLRAHLWLGVIGRPTLGLSVILAVDHVDHSFVIDALRQATGLVAGAPIYFDTQVEGRRMRFECRLVQQLTYDNGPAYRVREPQLVLDQQRRSTYRVRVPIDVRVPAAVGEAGRLAPARLLDLSAQGCSTRTEPPLTVSTGDAVRVHLRLGSFDLDCGARVRNVQRTGGASRVGVEFELDETCDAGALGQAVARLQREILRRRQG